MYADSGRKADDFIAHTATVWHFRHTTPKCYFLVPTTSRPQYSNPVTKRQCHIVTPSSLPYKLFKTRAATMAYWCVWNSDRSCMTVSETECGKQKHGCDSVTLNWLQRLINVFTYFLIRSVSLSQYTRCPAIRAVRGCGLALTALGMDWTEDDTMKTTVNDISNLIFLERKHACWTELLKNGDGRTDAPSLHLAPGRSGTDRTRRLLDLTWLRLTRIQWHLTDYSAW